jgi:hypothetical protein
MRLSLLGFNLVAVAALVTPALLIFDAAGPAMGPWGQAYLAAFVIGAVLLLAAMARLSGKRADPAGAAPLLVMGLALIAVPVAMLVTVSLNR